MVPILLEEQGKRVTFAREFCGLTKRELAERIGLSRQSVSGIENGRQQASPGAIAAMSRLTDFPVAFFLLDSSIPVDKSERMPVTYRRFSRASKRELKQAETLEVLAAAVWNYLESKVDLPVTDIPRLSAHSSEYSNADIEMAAQHVRRTWRLGDGPISNLTALLELHGIRLTRTWLADSLDAFSCWRSDRAIVVDRLSPGSAVRLRFSLAHELGHLVLHGSTTPQGPSDIDLRAKMERQANRFASAFLMPSPTFGAEFYSTNLDYLSQLKLRWKCSVQSMAMRAKALGLLNENQVAYVYRQLGSRTGEPYDDKMVPESAQVLRRAVETLLSASPATAGEMLDSLRITATRFSDLTGIEIPGSEDSRILRFPNGRN